MKFSEMNYQRLDLADTKEQLSNLTKAFKEADTYQKAKEIFLEKETLSNHISTLYNLASIRNTIDTRDKFYDEEISFWNDAQPQLEEYMQEFDKVLLQSPFRNDFAEEYGQLMFLNAEIRQKQFSPSIISKLQKENNLVQSYVKLLASAQIPFNGSTYTLSQLTPFKNDADDRLRLDAWKAEGRWYKDNQAEFDTIYDNMVKLRDEIGKDLGYEGFTTLGYYRMNRNCYRKEDVECFREAVVKYIVPVADSIIRARAQRLGKSYPLSYADMALEFRSGNPKPKGTAQDILSAGRKFYSELSPITGRFFDMMLENELMNVLSTEGKASGGYCTSLEDYKVPFIFANFNGTQGDVEVVTHEAGHAFAGYINADRIPSEYRNPTLESCEVHSMSMEFFAWPWAEDFFGEDADKFRYSHLASALTFIPYGTMVDHFQHIVYEKPQLTPAQRHETWKKLTGIYMPWVKLDGEIPFYGEGQAWQRQLHIYEMPFYYIDYCLAQTVSLEFWKMIGENRHKAWDSYMRYTKQGGSRTFTDLLKNADLESPFEESCLKGIAETAARWLDAFDQDKLK